jgi:glycosyltransferase involved in cell wall biosynthesis
MRIGIFLPHALEDIGGAERATDELARHLIRRGHHVAVLAMGDPKAANAPYPLYRFKKPCFHRYWPTWIARPLVRLHGREHLDVILCAGGEPTGYAAVRAGRKMQVPVVLISHGGDLYRGSFDRRRPRRWARIVYAYRHADALIALSPYLEQLIREVEPDPGLLEEISNGIDADRVATPAICPRDFSDPRPFCLCLGNFWPAKGFSYAIKAFAEVNALLGSLTMLMVGRGQQELACRDQVQRLGLGGRILFLGQRTGNDQRWLLQNCRFGVMPSLEEGHSLVGLEYLAAGKPVVCTDRPFFDRDFVQGVNALRVPPRDATALGWAMVQLNTSDLTAMGQASLARARHMAWPLIVQRYEAFLGKVIARHRAAVRPATREWGARLGGTDQADLARCHASGVVGGHPQTSTTPLVSATHA